MISIWEKETFFAPADIIILGSGFVGLWSAIHLKKKNSNLSIKVIDRGIIPAGASTRNAGFACFGSLSELVRDAAEMGQDKMLQLVEMRYRGLERIQQFFSAKEIDFALCGGYELYELSDAITTPKLKENISELNSLLSDITGTKDTFKLADDQIDSFGFSNTRHLVKNNLEGCLHSGKLLQCLLQMASSMGVQVFPSIEITGFYNKEERIILTTNKSVEFTCNQLLICTNAFAKQLVPDIDVKPARGQVILTSPIEGLPLKGTFHSDEGYYYFRNLGNRVLLGGARNKAFQEEETTEMEITSLIQNELERYLSQVILPRFQGKYTIEHRWSGIMAMGTEKMPILKEIDKNIYCAVRMSGMGVALAPVVGETISEMLLS